MAYLRELKRLCRECRLRAAVVELVNRRNAGLGEFCRRCGERRLKEQLEREKLREVVR
jgi:superfamily II helicase